MPRERKRYHNFPVPIVFFIIFAATLIFLMQTGFAMLCTGSIRSKNVQNVMLKNLLDACGGAIGFWSFG